MGSFLYLVPPNTFAYLQTSALEIWALSMNDHVVCFTLVLESFHFSLEVFAPSLSQVITNVVQL